MQRHMLRCGLALLGVAAFLVILSGTALAQQGPDPERYIVKFADPGQGRAAVAAAGGAILLELPEVSAAAAKLPAQALSALRSHPAIDYIERDHVRYPMAQTSPYGIAMVQADQVSDAQAGDRKICIIDSGYSLGHEDLPEDNSVQGTNDSGTGDWFVDGCAHGTHVAGTIVALDNDVGVLGVLPNNNLNLHIVKVFGNDCAWAYSSSLVNAANVCANNGANVISMSLGGSFSSTTERNAFQSLFDDGILSVAAAGNSGNTQFSYPASYDSVISVAAVDSAKQLASFSQRNSQVELAAPGVAVRSTVPMGTGTEESLSVGSDAFEVVGMEGSPDATGTGPLVDCGLGTSACPGGGGQVCLIERGEITFADKVLNCEAGGGVGAVIYNNAEALFSGTLGGTATTIPSVGTSGTTGSILTGRLGDSATVTTGPGNYAFFDGTSMATPHVSGVAALVWSHDASWTNQQIRDALAATAEDLGDAGRDNSFGWGLVQASAALDLLTGGDVNDPPSASFTFDCTDLACDFDGSGSTDGDGSIVSYDWDFGDGNTGSGATVSHTYAADGTYTVTLTVTDDDDATDSASQDVTVSAGGDVNDPPNASFTFDCTDLACDFDGTGSTDGDGSIVSYDWDFGDDNTGSGATVSHTYAAGGTYTVTLTVTDNDGAMDSASQSVTVSEDTGDEITLSATGFKVRGVHTVDLSWSGASGTSVDIYRDDTLVTTTANDGFHTDSAGGRGKGTYVYQVCEAGTTTCSNSVTVEF